METYDYSLIDKCFDAVDLYKAEHGMTKVHLFNLVIALNATTRKNVVNAIVDIFDYACADHGEIVADDGMCDGEVRVVSAIKALQ